MRFKKSRVRRNPPDRPWYDAISCLQKRSNPSLTGKKVPYGTCLGVLLTGISQDKRSYPNSQQIQPLSLFSGANRSRADGREKKALRSPIKESAREPMIFARPGRSARNSMLLSATSSMVSGCLQTSRLWNFWLWPKCFFGEED